MDRPKLQERNRTALLSRRRFSIGLCLGLVGVAGGCGGTYDETAAGGDPTHAAMSGESTRKDGMLAGVHAWEVAPSRALTLSAGASFDLSTTLPPGVAPGGTFQVDASGAALPPGISLLPSGLLTVSSTAAGSTAGVVFRYTPPA
jgi:hypothetical protein